MGSRSDAMINDIFSNDSQIRNEEGNEVVKTFQTEDCGFEMHRSLSFARRQVGADGHCIQSPSRHLTFCLDISLKRLFFDLDAQRKGKHSVRG